MNNQLALSGVYGLQGNPLVNSNIESLTLDSDVMQPTFNAGREFKLALARNSILQKHAVPPSKAVCMTIKGNSMEPILPDGAIVGVNLDEKRIINNKIYAFRHSDVLRIKQLSWNKDNTINIHSFNSSRKDETAYLEEMEIIGQVFTWSVYVKD
ncbi:MAG: helix-turn-helix transcriptional regulator [Gilliamella sp.]|nr:helix-turn-helix transcriptional regulator [Gilliamella sp.]